MKDRSDNPSHHDRTLHLTPFVVMKHGKKIVKLFAIIFHDYKAERNHLHTLFQRQDSHIKNYWLEQTQLHTNKTLLNNPSQTPTGICFEGDPRARLAAVEWNPTQASTGLHV